MTEFYSSVPISTIICLHFPPHYFAASILSCLHWFFFFFFSFRYGSYFSSLGLIPGPISHGCRLQIKTDCPPRHHHPDRLHTPTLPPEHCRCFIKTNSCFLPSVRIFKLLCLRPVFITFVSQSSQRKKHPQHCTNFLFLPLLPPTASSHFNH